MSTMGRELIRRMQEALDADFAGCKVTRVKRNDDGSFTHTEGIIEGPPMTPTQSTLEKRERRIGQECCTICPPFKGENARGRKPKHGADKPKSRRRRGK